MTPPPDPILWLALVAGACVGSFLNVAALRWPLGGSVVRPGSTCPACQSRIAARDRLPVVSWILLRGRCRQCHAAISPRYPLVEAAAALGTLALVLHFGPGLEALHVFVFFALLFAVALSDARYYLIPDLLTLGGCGLGLALAGLPGAPGLPRAALGAGLGYVGFRATGALATALARRRDPQRLERALREHDRWRGDAALRRLVARYRSPRSLGLVLMAVAALTTFGLRDGPALAATVAGGGLATLALLLAWMESFDATTFDLETVQLENSELRPDDLSALGEGDVRLMAMVGAFLGPGGLIVATFLGSVIALLLWLPIHRIARQLVPLGVFLAAGAALARGLPDALQPLSGVGAVSLKAAVQADDLAVPVEHGTTAQLADEPGGAAVFAIRLLPRRTHHAPVVAGPTVRWLGRAHPTP